MLHCILWICGEEWEVCGRRGIVRGSYEITAFDVPGRGLGRDLAVLGKAG